MAGGLGGRRAHRSVEHSVLSGAAGEPNGVEEPRATVQSGGNVQSFVVTLRSGVDEWAFTVRC